jgi:Nucleotidyl transferase AbiEii toxin, Type IV TA system
VLIRSIIVAQMLPDGVVVKGGIGVKFRLGEVGTRATTDVDVVAQDRADFLRELNERLSTGWGAVPASRGALKKNPDAPPRLAFNGQARPDRQPQPGDVPAEYLMKPYNVTLNFLGRPWASVPVEVAHDEIGGLEQTDVTTQLAEQIVAVGRILGFGELEPVRLISLEQQIAQKIHAATEPASERAHDLLDLQLLWEVAAEAGKGLDVPLLANLCRRTFQYRARHGWPPTAAMSEVLEPAYAAAKEEARSYAESAIPFAENINEACAWLNELIEEIDRHD